MHKVLIIAAVILEILATVGLPAGRFSLMAAGLACFFGAALV